MAKPKNGKNDAKSGNLSPEEADLWHEMTKDVKKLAGKNYKKAENKDKKPILKPKRPENSILEPKTSQKTAKGREIDARTAQKLRRGQIRPEARLDLHGMSQAQARTDLYAFISRAYAAGKRCVLVITGKGREKQGILKTRVPEWLTESQMMNMVLQFTAARPQEGGDGALYVYLRRQRN